jgi:hypothetical protein
MEPVVPPIWLPYSQMKTAPPALEAMRTQGVRIELAEGRELIDGIASWWTACHGYNHPHIRAAVADQLERMPHVMLRRPVTGLNRNADEQEKQDWGKAAACHGSGCFGHGCRHWGQSWGGF